MLAEILMRNVVSVVLALSLVPFTPTHPRLAAAPADACGLLTKGEIDAAMGVPMGPPKAITAKACQWRELVKQGNPGAIVDVTLIQARGYDMGKAAGGSGPIKVTAISSLGDDAYSSAMNAGKETSLRVKKGETYVAIHVWGAGVPIPQIAPKELALAKVIVPKL